MSNERLSVEQNTPQEIAAPREQRNKEPKEVRRAKRKERKRVRKEARKARRFARKERRKARRLRRRERRAYWRDWRENDYRASRDRAISEGGQEGVVLTRMKVPPYIYASRSQWLIITFTAIFALLFINIYTPFNSLSWAPMSETLYFVGSSIVVGGGMVLVILSRLLMMLYTRHRGITYWLYVLWVLAEVGLMAIGFTICAVAMKMQNDFMEALGIAFKNTALVFVIPYLISIIFLSWRENTRRLRSMEQQIATNSSANISSHQTTPIANSDDAAEEEQMEVAAQQPHKQQHTTPAHINFYDERNELRLSVESESLIYIEAADNYTCIHYISKGALRKTMIRSSLKRIGEQLAESNVRRCHRSYMVNLDQVKIIRRGKDGVYLEMGIKDVPDIPISKTYSNDILKWFIG